jgi:hypothetical protein
MNLNSNLPSLGVERGNGPAFFEGINDVFAAFLRPPL